MSSLLLRRPLAFALVILLVTACATTQEAERAPEVPRSSLFFWKVSNDGQPGTIYLLGTVHLRDASSASLDQAVLDRVDAADELVFEIVPDETSTEDVQAATQELGILPEGESLLEAFDEDTRAALVNAANKVGLPIAALDRLRPWLAAITFTVLRMKLQGYSEEAGTERLLLARARAKGDKRTSSLETADEQLRLFASLPEETQLEMVREIVNDIAAQERGLEDMQRAYERGDDAALRALVFEGRGEKPEVEALYRAMFDDRNTRMVERMAPLFAQDQETVVAVGVGHMLGERGIPALLVQQGYRVEAVPALGLAPVRPEGSAPVGAFVDEELGFSAEFHAAPRVTRQQVPTPGGGSAEIVMVTSDERLLELSVVVNTFPAPLDGDPQRLSLMFDAMVARMAEQFGAVEVNERLTVQGSPAARFVTSSEGRSVEGLVIVRGARMYSLVATRSGEASGPAKDAREEAARRFLASFKLLTAEVPSSHE